MQFNRAIPGQSLTTPPKSAPYERPPQISDPLEAIDYHLEQLDDPKTVEELMFFLQLGIDLSTLVEGVARKAVLDGIHSIDISLSIAPVIHEYIKGYADAMDIDYDEGFEDEEQDRKLSEARTEILARKFLAQRQRDFDYDEEQLSDDEIASHYQEGKKLWEETTEIDISYSSTVYNPISNQFEEVSDE